MKKETEIGLSREVALNSKLEHFMPFHILQNLFNINIANNIS